MWVLMMGIIVGGDDLEKIQIVVFFIYGVSTDFVIILIIVDRRRR